MYYYIKAHPAQIEHEMYRMLLSNEEKIIWYNFSVEFLNGFGFWKEGCNGLHDW